MNEIENFGRNASVGNVKNPIVKGFYPDPSVCEANGKYYMVCSSMQFFPGVPLFESEDLVNWKQIGHVLTRPSQIDLETVNSSGGVFAPTIRFNNGTFYMVTTNDTYHKNFYVTTKDIYGEWSEPIFVDQGGIDPSLLFEDGKCYFMSNGSDEDNNGCIFQCEINPETGEKLSESRPLWKGSGGRYLESPHLYHIGDYYYVMAAEGGTEYGHMITYARGKSPYGPFENYVKNPVLTNRNLGGHQSRIQGIGHGDLIKGPDGGYYIICLGFRQLATWTPYHHLGREVFITPAEFDEKGWFTAGNNSTAYGAEKNGNEILSGNDGKEWNEGLRGGTEKNCNEALSGGNEKKETSEFSDRVNRGIMRAVVSIPACKKQEEQDYSLNLNSLFENPVRFTFLRKPAFDNYAFEAGEDKLRYYLDGSNSGLKTEIGKETNTESGDYFQDKNEKTVKAATVQNENRTEKESDLCFMIRQTPVTLFETLSPSFAGVRQSEFNTELHFTVDVADGEAGVTVYYDENNHFDVYLSADKHSGARYVNLRLCEGDLKSVVRTEMADEGPASIKITSSAYGYSFFYEKNGKDIPLGSAQSRYLSSEVCGGFTGVVAAMYAVNTSGECEWARFSDFEWKQDFTYV